MSDFSIIFAENVQQWYCLDPANFKTRLSCKFDDNPFKHWWERSVYYDYDFINYVNPKTNNQAIIVSFWDVKGRVFGCPDCGMTKLWYVKECFNQNESNNLENIRAALFEIIPMIPYKVFLDFSEKLKKNCGLTLYNEETLKKI